MAYFNNYRGGEVKYNLGSNQLENIGNSMNGVSSAFKQDNPYLWFKDVKAIKLSIISRLNEKERAGLHTQEVVIKKWLSQLRPIGLQHPEINEKINKFVMEKVNPLIEDYNIAVYEFLEVKGFLVPTKQDRTNLFENTNMEDFE